MSHFIASEAFIFLNFRGKNVEFKKDHQIWIFPPKMSILKIQQIWIFAPKIFNYKQFSMFGNSRKRYSIFHIWIFAVKIKISGLKIQMILFHLILFHCVFEFVRFLLCIPEIRNVILRSLKMMVIFWFMFNCHHWVLRITESAVNLLFLLEMRWANVR